MVVSCRVQSRAPVSVQLRRPRLVRRSRSYRVFPLSRAETRARIARATSQMHVQGRLRRQRLIARARRHERFTQKRVLHRRAALVFVFMAGVGVAMRLRRWLLLGPRMPPRVVLLLARRRRGASRRRVGFGALSLRRSRLLRDSRLSVSAATGTSRPLRLRFRFFRRLQRSGDARLEERHLKHCAAVGRLEGSQCRQASMKSSASRLALGTSFCSGVC